MLVLPLLLTLTPPITVTQAVPWTEGGVISTSDNGMGDLQLMWIYIGGGVQLHVFNNFVLSQRALITLSGHASCTPNIPSVGCSEIYFALYIIVRH